MATQGGALACLDHWVSFDSIPEEAVKRAMEAAVGAGKMTWVLQG
jgi:DNA replication protein DnaD